MLSKRSRENTRKSVNSLTFKLTNNGKRWKDRKWLSMMRDSEKNLRRNTEKDRRMLTTLELS
jgi:hypothetical protein